MTPMTNSFVGFASAVIGLLCYALSSSFNYLFGKWNLLKIFLYSIFSFIICLVILLAKKFQRSRSLRFKAHSAFLVLTITSVYSFFFDEVVNGKPDAYSLISCASFAIMSLSLSRQTQCGFEIDLLYFFLGCLTVLLMKIKLQLFIIGAGFSYFIVILRSSFSFTDVATANEYEHPPTSLEDENLVVIEVHSHSTTDIGSSMVVVQLSNHVKALQQENSTLIEMLLEKLKEYLNDDSGFNVSDPDFMIEALPTEIIDTLHKTANLMVSAGFEKDFSDVYISCRKEYLVESLSRLGFRQLSIEDVQMLSWKELEQEIERWIKAFVVALKTLFPTERKLCNRVFFGFSSAADLSFTDLCRESTLQLLNFADAIAVGSRSPERLFRVINMFETMRDLIPEFEFLFHTSLQYETTTIWKRLGEAIRGIFMELENQIRQDPGPGEVAVPGGRLHPITRYVMNYLRVASESWQTLEQVFDEEYVHPLKEYPEIEDRMHSSTLSVQMDWIMELLESNLEVKSKIYEDPALCYVFLMNNCSYIVQKIEDSDLETILGDVMIRKHTAKIRQHREHYERSSWNKVLDILMLDNNETVQPDDVAKSMKEKLKSFNMLFEEISRVQSSWFIFDKHLREEIRFSIVKLLLPAYRNFIGTFQRVLEFGKHDKNIKYGMEDIEARLDNLFQGNSGPTKSQK